MRIPKDRMYLSVLVALGLVGSGVFTGVSGSADDLVPVQGDGQTTKGAPAPPSHHPTTAPPQITATQEQSLEAALEEGPPPGVDRVIKKANRTARSRIEYTSLVRRALGDAIKRRDLPELQSLPSLENVPARDVLKALNEVQAEKVFKDRLSKLTGTTPPPDLQHRVLTQNALAKAVLTVSPPRVRSTPGLKVPTPSLPKFDWREKGWIVKDSGIVTAVQDQSTPVSCGCCWAFATIGALEASYAKNNLLLIGASEQYLLDCAGAALQPTMNLSWNCNGGWWAFDMLMTNNGGLVAVPGAPNRSDLPYVGVQSPCQDNLPRPYKVLTWGYVSTGGPNAIPTDDELKQAICKYGPVAVAVMANEFTWMGNAGDVIQDFPNNLSASVNHAVVLVGWDNSKNAWIFKNSWGPWGIQDSGFGYMRYGCNNIGWGAAWVIPVSGDGS
jgi:hypothetical protein